MDGQLIVVNGLVAADGGDIAPCIEHVGAGADVAIAFCDEPVTDAPPPPDAVERFADACSIAASYGIHLVDWIACDDQLLRSMRLACEPEAVWWPEP